MSRFKLSAHARRARCQTQRGSVLMWCAFKPITPANEPRLRIAHATASIPRPPWLLHSPTIARTAWLSSMADADSGNRRTSAAIHFVIYYKQGGIQTAVRCSQRGQRAGESLSRSSVTTFLQRAHHQYPFFAQSVSFGRASRRSRSCICAVVMAAPFLSTANLFAGCRIGATVKRGVRLPACAK
jgi:hypothetical protein